MTKSLIKKISATVLVMMFFIQPLCQFLTHSGIVNAAVKEETWQYVTYGPNSNPTSFLGPNETAVLERTEYRYQVRYIGGQNNVKVWNQDLKNLRDSWVYSAALNGYFQITEVSEKSSDGLHTRTGRLGLYRRWKCYVSMEALWNSVWTPYQRKVKDFPEYPAIAYNGEINTKLYPATIQKTEIRRVWKITKRTVTNTPTNTATNTATNTKPTTSQSGNAGSSATSTATSLYNNLISTAQNMYIPTATTTTPSGSPVPTTTGNGSNGNSAGSTATTQVIDRSDLNDNARRLYIRGLYKRVLGREPSNDEIESHFKNISQKTARDIIFSTESNNRNKINSMSNDQFVEACYSYILGRTADKSGKETWVKYLTSGNSRESAVNAFVASAEFKNNYNKATSTLTFNETTCTAVYDALRNSGFSVIRPSKTTILMYGDDVNKVSTLDLGGKGISDLGGLAKFKNLKKLTLSSNKVSNLAPIAELTNLEELILNNNQLKSIDALGKLTKLTKLHMNNCGLTSFNVDLSKLTNLIELRVERNSLISKGIEKLPTNGKLDRIYLNNNQISDLTGYGNITSLKALYVDNNNVKNAPAFSNLEKLSIKNNTVVFNTSNGECNIPTLLTNARNSSSKLYTSTELECKNCRIENNKIIMNADAKIATVVVKGGNADGTKVTLTNKLTIVGFTDRVLAEKIKNEFELTQMREENGKYYLYIPAEKIAAKKAIDLSNKSDDSEKITDLTGIEALSQLTNINLRNNNISDFSILSRLPNLQSLDIRYNGLTNLNSLKDVKQLQQLDASNNNITDISGLSGMTKLQDLLLSNNNIGNNLEPVSDLANLLTLSLSNNGITSVSNLSKLKLGSLYLDYNGISDISVINRENIKVLSIENNKVKINIQGTECDIPTIIQKAINDGNTSDLELSGCSISGNKIKLDEGVKLAQVKINSGDLRDTVVILQDEETVTPPTLTFEYELSQDKKSIEARIISDKKIKKLAPWGLDETGKVLYRTFNCDIANQNVTVSDLYGNEASITINCSGIENQYIPKLTMNYSETKPTNEGVTVTLTSDEELMEIDGWLHTDGNVNAISKTFEENQPFAYVQVMSKRIFDLTGQPRVVDYQVLNIDKQAPSCKVEYDTKERTKGSVRVTIWADEEIEAVNAFDYTKAVRIGEDGNTEYGITLYYSNNTNGFVTVRDEAYNISLVNVIIDNIDTSVDGLYTEMNATTSRNDSVKLKVHANENINVTNTIETMKEAALNKITTYRIATNVLLDSSSFGYSEPLYRIAEEPGQGSTSNNNGTNEIEMDYTEDEMYVLEATDNTNNKDLALINTSVIDKNEMSIEREDVVNSDGSVTVILRTNEPVLATEKIEGWELGDDLQTLTKTFYQNQNQILELEDFAGNITTYDASVVNMDNFDYGVIYYPIDGTDQMLVVIEANRELQEMDGWELSEDKKHLGKTMSIDEIQTVLVFDTKGNSEEISIKYDGEGKDDNDSENQNTAVEDNTQSNKPMPQTGEFILLAIVISLILTAITGITLYRYKKENI